MTMTRGHPLLPELPKKKKQAKTTVQRKKKNKGSNCYLNKNSVILYKAISYFMLYPYEQSIYHTQQSTLKIRGATRIKKVMNWALLQWELLLALFLLKAKITGYEGPYFNVSRPTSDRVTAARTYGPSPTALVTVLWTISVINVHTVPALIRILFGVFKTIGRMFISPVTCCSKQYIVVNIRPPCLKIELRPTCSRKSAHGYIYIYISHMLK